MICLCCKPFAGQACLAPFVLCVCSYMCSPGCQSRFPFKLSSVHVPHSNVMNQDCQMPNKISIVMKTRRNVNSPTEIREHNNFTKAQIACFGRRGKPSRASKWILCSLEVFSGSVKPSSFTLSATFSLKLLKSQAPKQSRSPQATLSSSFWLKPYGSRALIQRPGCPNILRCKWPSS